ncbi:MAG: ABC transporter ATP-binding protein [Chloroflexota bacterium]|nr:ABC transporter ATP-binding protein [Chloroflexota bacterium]
MREHWRGFRVLMVFGLRAAPWQAVVFLVSAFIMSLEGLVVPVGLKLLADAAVALDLRAGLVAAFIIAATAGLAVVNLQFYVTLIFTVVERAGALIDKRLMELTTGIAGLEHHERPAYLDEMAILRERRGSLAWMTNAAGQVIQIVVQLVGSAILLAGLHPLLLLLPLFGVGSTLAERRGLAIKRRTDQITAERVRLREQIFGIATSAEAGKEVRIFGLRDELFTRHRAVYEAQMRDRERGDWQIMGLQTAGSLLFAVGYIGAIALVLVRAIQGLATPGDVLLAISLASQTHGVLSQVIAYGSGLVWSLSVARRYLWLEDYAQRKQEVIGEPAPVPARLTQGITVRDLTFRYPGTDALVLRDVSLALPAGGVVALVGENGAGKTTLVKLLSRFYEPDAGRIAADGIDLRRFQVDEWRPRLSTGFQDFSRFEFVARETVGGGKLPAIDDVPAVEAALGRAGADDVPGTLPAGLETQLGRDWDGGVDLSGGEWQKLALGRAFMRLDPLLVILDEPTAAIDAQTEHALFERIAAEARRDERRGTVTILVSHRFSTVRMADHIVVLDKGRILEQGSHDDLMRNEQLYAELYRLQSRAYR